MIFRAARELGVVEPVRHLACLAREWQLAVDQGLGEQGPGRRDARTETVGKNALTLIGHSRTRW